MGMNTLPRTQSDSLPLRNQLAQKLHPYRHPQMSGLMSAIVGFVIEAPFGAPRIVEITVTPDHFILARPEGEVSLVSVGRYDDLLFAWSALLSAARLTNIERIEAQSLFAHRIGFLGVVNA
jgi:hypothetical protein